MRNDELSQPLLCGASNQGMILQDRHSLGDEIDRLQCSAWLGLQKKIGEPTQIGERSLRVDYARQTLALGFLADLPWTRSRR